MSCWVVPSLAAEIWGTSVDHVLRQIQSGELCHRIENGWTFVDVAPDGCVSSTLPLPATRRPKTYTDLCPEELAALELDEESDLSTTAVEEDSDPDPEPEASGFKDWRTGRHRASRLRLAPPKFVTI